MIYRDSQTVELCEFIIYEDARRDRTTVTPPWIAVAIAETLSTSVGIRTEVIWFKRAALRLTDE
ncbi:Hypothetical protein FKW44_014694 [Caligus rogercresseyi]|uniref:Uncharacterized protein n=1 Tax=Caligus rogercresseyi TaxID=217165 RepID=A0A7T8GZC5_CALRO|nr:Hypothetical protein FKW44_014694 [Caligus rogercresseyi]